MAAISRRLALLLRYTRILEPPLWSFPSIFEPALRGYRSRFSTQPLRKSINIESSTSDPTSDPALLLLPRSCPGCGAFTQDLRSDQAGFYSLSRKPVRRYLERIAVHGPRTEETEDSVFDQVSRNLNHEQWLDLINDESHAEDLPKSGRGGADIKLVESTPVCDRCHRLMHHHSGVPVIHTTINSVKDIISDSPYKHNHIYHVLDAADFPLSLVPSLQSSLSLAPQRSRNRRAVTEYFKEGRKADISFIITRADLLAPNKEQVDRLVPYLVEVLRGAIGGSANHVRLGNVHCVSSKRGWWTKVIKENIWNRGGAGWMVGKANVGKSNLFECVFPKGRSSRASERENQIQHPKPGMPHNAVQFNDFNRQPSQENSTDDIQDSLLPPAPAEQDFPTLPIVSSLPGTTAAPIRNLFGNGKGELIDLPGLPRGDLHEFVAPKHEKDLVMCQRIKPKQYTIKPGKSLIVGGLLRITSCDPDAIVLAYPFIPLPIHVTSTEKAKAMFEQQTFPPGLGIGKADLTHRVIHAGTFPLKWDVTKARTGSLTRKDAGGMLAERLPFVVLSTDVLIEGCGWIELVAQVRKRRLETEGQGEGLFDIRPYPMVEVFSPDGGHVGVRKPMGAWSLCAMKPGESKTTSRPRRSMSGMKRQRRAQTTR